MKNSEKFWDRQAYRYDKLNSRYEEQYQDSIDITKKYLERSHRILDYGCGTGITTMALAASVQQIVAVDISERMLEVAKMKSIKKQISNIEFNSANIMDPNYDGMKFDAVLVFNTLYFIRNVDEVLLRIYELLSTGGLFISVTDCLGEKPSLRFKLMKYFSGLRFTPYMRFYTMAKLEGSIQKHGFDITETRNLHPQPPNYLIVSRKSNS